MFQWYKTTESLRHAYFLCITVPVHEIYDDIHQNEAHTVLSDSRPIRIYKLSFSRLLRLLHFQLVGLLHFLHGSFRWRTPACTFTVTSRAILLVL